MSSEQQRSHIVVRDEENLNGGDSRELEVKSKMGCQWWEDVNEANEDANED